MDIKVEININTLIVGDCNTSLTSMDISFRHQIKKEMVGLNDTIDQMGQLISSEHFIQKQQNIHTCEVNMEHFLG